MNQNISTRALVEGALFAVITALLALVGIYIPPLQFITNLVWTLPVIVVIIRNNVRVGVMTTTVAGLLVFLFSNPLSSILLLLKFGGVGITYGILFKRQASAGKTLAYGTIVALISTLLALTFSLTVTGVDLQAMKQSLEASVGPVMEIYKQTGLIDKLKETGMTEQQLQDIIKASVDMAIVLLPAGFVLGSIFSAFMNFYVARIVLRKLNFTIPEMPPFSQWRLPWYVVYGFILGLAALLIGNNYNLSILSNIGKNVLYVYVPLLFIIGISIVTYFFKSEKILPLVKGLVIFLALINLPLAVIITLTLGLFDPLLDYRKLERRG